MAPTPLKYFILSLLFSTTVAQAELISPSFHYTTPKSIWGLYLADTEIVKNLSEMFDRAQPGSEIHMSLYNFEDMPDDKIFKAIERAYKRGVDIWAVMDDSANEILHQPARNNLQKLLGAHVRICKQEGCLTAKGNNHNKFYLFSKVKDGNKVLEHVVIQASANVGLFQAAKFNDMVIIHSEKGLYDGYLAYWGTLFSERKTDNYMNGPGGIVESGAFKAYFTPAAYGDPVMEALSKTTCAGGGVIRAAQSSFEQERALEMIRQLKRLKAAGCNVAIAVRKSGEDNQYTPELKASGLEVYELGTVMHAKFTAINAVVDGVHKQLVFTGSANMKDSSIRKNDETMLQISGQRPFDTYIKFFDKIKKAGKRLK